jgi:hypothetical protein
MSESPVSEAMQEQRARLMTLVKETGVVVCEYQIRPQDEHHSQCRVCGHSLDAHCFRLPGPCASCVAQVVLLLLLQRSFAP